MLTTRTKVLASALLIPLALTSTNEQQKGLGGSWEVLHRPVYFAVRLTSIKQSIARRGRRPQVIASENKDSG